MPSYGGYPLSGELIAGWDRCDPDCAAAAKMEENGPGGLGCASGLIEIGFFLFHHKCI